MTAAAEGPVTQDGKRMEREALPQERILLVCAAMMCRAHVVSLQNRANLRHVC